MKISLRDSTQFRKLLMERWYSKRQFSIEIGTSEAYLNQIINMKKQPSPDVAKKIGMNFKWNFTIYLFMND